MIAKRRISGEYPRIAQKTSNYELLDRLHDTPITQGAALELIKDITGTFSIKIGEVKFKPDHNGRAMWKTRNLILPSTPKNGNRRVGRLRVGIVVHELAHLTAVDRGCKTHGDAFIKILDELAAHVDKQGWYTTAPTRRDTDEARAQNRQTRI